MMHKKLINLSIILAMILVQIQRPEAKPAKTIIDYYNALKSTLGIDQSYRIVKKDVVNGFLSVTSGNGFANTNIDMALWRSRSGKEIVGVFEYGCGGMGCWGKLVNFKFFDANLREVRSKVVDWAKLEQMHRRAVSNEAIQQGIPTVMVTIPQKGTTIKIVSGPMGSNPKPLVQLYYDINRGTFTIKK